MAALPPAPGRTTRRLPFAASVAAALLLNGLLLDGLAVKPPKWRVGPPPDRRVASVIVTKARSVPEAPVPPPAPAARPPSVAPTPPAPAVAKPAQPVLAAPEAPPADTSAQPLDGQATRFYAFSEVDQAAEPDSDWNLDAALLDGAGLRSFVFEAFVSATGDVVACTILRPADLPDGLRESLEERLRRTSLRPAVRAGEAVASVRRIELSVQ